MATFQVLDKPEIARLVRFSTGQLNPEIKEKLRFKCYRAKDEENSRKRKMTVMTEWENMKFSGQNHGDKNIVSSELCDYYVAIQRKGSDKLQVYPAEIFQLEPQIEEEAKLDDEEEADTTNWEKRRNLIHQFGSGQMQKKVRNAEKMQMEEGMLTQTTKSAIDYVKTLPAVSEYSGTKAPEVNQTDSGVNLPYNKNATYPEEVYAIETTIPPSLMETLAQQSTPFLSCSPDIVENWRRTSVYPGSICDLLTLLPPSESDRQFLCSCIMYLNILIHVYKMKAHEFRSREKYPKEWAGEIRKWLDACFTITNTERNGKKNTTRTSTQKDLLLSHILVLRMRLCNYSMSLKPLVVDLKLTMKRLHLHSQLLGFKTFYPKAGELNACLVLPLTFPTPYKKPDHQPR